MLLINYCFVLNLLFKWSYNDMNIRVFIYLKNDEFRHILQFLHGDKLNQIVSPLK